MMSGTTKLDITAQNLTIIFAKPQLKTGQFLLSITKNTLNVMSLGEVEAFLIICVSNLRNHRD